MSGPEFDDLVQQAANDALVTIIARLDDFQGRSRFTTWAYKFAIFALSSHVARHAWRRQPPTPEDLAWNGVAHSLAPRPGERAERREQLQTLAAAIDELTDRQRRVFVAVALNDVSIDLLALQLGSNRNAVYLFDARRKLRSSLADAGYPVIEKDALSG